MTDHLRLAGTWRLPDGALVTWTVADGRRGRRWRASSTVDGQLTHALLIEVDPAGRVARLELATPAGLLTLHPDASETTLHGNIVTLGGVQPVTFAWSRDHALSVDGRPIADAVTAHRITETTRVGERRKVALVAIAPDLTLREATFEFEPVRYRLWRISSSSRADPRRRRGRSVDNRAGSTRSSRKLVDNPVSLAARRRLS
jgi:hypothetical protein